MSAAEDTRTLYHRMAGVAADLIEGVRPEQLDAPTPCPGLSVRELLAHLVDSTHGLAGIGEGRGPWDPTGAPAAHEVPDGGWPAEYRRARERFGDAWRDDAKLERTFSVPWGEVPGSGVVAGAAMESAAHAWDLAEAVGAGPLPHPETAGAVLELTRPMVPAERRGEGVPFGPVQEPSADADAYGRLAAWLGRPAGWRG